MNNRNQANNLTPGNIASAIATAAATAASIHLMVNISVVNKKNCINYDGLAAALKDAKLRKTPKSRGNSVGSTTNSSGSSSYGSIGKGKEDLPPMVSMMDKIQKLLPGQRVSDASGNPKTRNRGNN